MKKKDEQKKDVLGLNDHLKPNTKGGEMKIGKGLGRALKVVGLAQEVPDVEPASTESAPAEEISPDQEAETPTQVVATAKPGKKVAAAKVATISPKTKAALTAVLNQVPSFEVFENFEAQMTALREFVPEEGKRVLAAVKSARILAPTLHAAFTARLQALNGEIERMVADIKEQTSIKLGASETELRQTTASISKKTKELTDLQNKAEQLKATITSGRQEFDMSIKSIQATGDQLRSEITDKQTLVKKHLK